MRPRGDRNPQDHTIGIVFVVDEGVRAYIERINIRGNTRIREATVKRPERGRRRNRGGASCPFMQNKAGM